MSIVLPTDTSPAEASPFYVDKGGILRPIGAGDDQKLNRLGDRFGCEFAMPPMVSAESGRIWISRLIRAQREGAIMDWPQPDLDIGNPGAAQVDGAGQSGSYLALKNMTPGYVIRDGQFFSIQHAGRWYTHFVIDVQTVGGDGKVTVPIAPMLRISPANSAGCSFVPKLEGFLEGNERGWSLSSARMVGISFRITEAR